MTKHDYSAFDAELLEQIQAGRSTFNELAYDAGSPMMGMARQFAKDDEWQARRVIERRLQELRRQGLIIFTRQGWRVSD